MFLAQGLGEFFQNVPSCHLLANFHPSGADAFVPLGYHLAPSAGAGEVMRVLPWTQRIPAGAEADAVLAAWNPGIWGLEAHSGPTATEVQDTEHVALETGEATGSASARS